MAPSIKVSTDLLGGLRLTPASAPGFDGQLETLYGENAAGVLNLKPYIMMLTNESREKIVGYTVLTTLSTDNGEAQVQSCRYTYPDAVGANEAMPRGREIRSGEKRVVTLDYWEIDPMAQDLDYFLRQHVEVHRWAFPAGINRVEVALDAVIYEDGRLIGPDNAGLADSLLEFLRAKRTLYARILDSPAPGMQVRSLFEEVHAMYLQLVDNPAPSAELVNSLAERDRKIPYPWRRAVEDARRLLRDHGEPRMIEAMRGALRTEELIIRRESRER